MFKFFSSIRNLFISRNRPLLNILIRTSNRPNYFRACYESIKKQSYTRVRIIVSYDDEATHSYLNEYRNITKVKVSPLPEEDIPLPEIEREDNRKFPPELYMNDLMGQVEKGFVLYMDDDDFYIQRDSLKTIVKQISSEDDLLFWRVQFPEGRVVPEDGYFGNPPVFCHISTIGFCFHSKYIPDAQWDGWRGSDFMVASKLYNIIPNKIYIDNVLSGLQRAKGYGGWGKRDDKN